MSKPAAGSKSLLTRLHPSKSLGVRLFLVFFIATMGIVLSLGYTSYSVAKRTIENNALTSNQQTVEQTAEKLEVILMRFEDSLGQLFYSRDIQDAVSQGSAAVDSSAKQQNRTERINSELNRWMSSVGGVQAVYLIPLNVMHLYEYFKQKTPLSNREEASFGMQQSGNVHTKGEEWM